MKNFTIAVASVLIFALGACAESVEKAVAAVANVNEITASKTIVKKSFAVGDFERISAGAIFKVIYTPAKGKPKVEVRTADNVMPLVAVAVEGGELQLRLNHNGSIRSIKSIDVYVSSPSLSGITLSGTAKGEIGGRLEAKSFEARLSGVSSLEAGKVDADRFEARLSGSSKMTVGNVVAASAKVRASGVSKAVVAVDAGETAMNVSGSAKAVVTGKATKAIVLASEHNTKYANETDPQSGHLWGDGAVAVAISATPAGEKPAKILKIYTRGLGHIGKAATAVSFV